MEKSNRLNAKDLINVGIYTAICAVICCAVAMTGVIPIMMVLLVVFVPLLTGIPYMLFLTKVKKFGMILILNILMGILMWVTGMSFYALIFWKYKIAIRYIVFPLHIIVYTLVMLRNVLMILSVLWFRRKCGGLLSLYLSTIQNMMKCYSRSGKLLNLWKTFMIICEVMICIWNVHMKMIYQGNLS